MFSSPLLLIPLLLCPSYGHSPPFQVGSEAMVEIPPASRSSSAAYLAAAATKGPWSSQVGHTYSVAAASEGPWLDQVRQLMHDRVTGSQETGRSNGFPPLGGSDPGREKSRPPLYRFWKLNAVGLALLTLSLCPELWLWAPRTTVFCRHSR